MTRPYDAEALGMLEASLAPLEPYLSDPAVVDIMLNSDGRVWIERLGEGVQRTGVFISAREAERMLRYVATLVQRELTDKQPTLACRLPKYGARLQALMPPIVSAPALSIRRPAAKVYPLQRYVDQQVLLPAHAEFLRSAIVKRQNILVGGSTGSGKTTFANALLQEIADADERVLILEDTPELQCPAENTQPILVVPPLYTWRHAVMDAMRMRPDRIIVGELRDGVALDYLKACGTGHGGGIATLHAQSTRGMLDRLCVLIEEVVPSAPREMVGETIHVCVHLQRDLGHPAGRSISGIDEVRGYDAERRAWRLEPVPSTGHSV